MSLIFNKILITFCLCAISSTLWAQWTSYACMNDVIDFCKFGDSELCICKNSAFLVDNQGELTVLTKGFGLSNSYLTAVGADCNGDFFAIGFDNGTLDVVKNGRLITIPDVSLGSSWSPTKTIHKIVCHNKKIVVAGNFGVAIVDADRVEVMQLARHYSPILDCYVADGMCFAVSQNETLCIGIDSPDFQNPTMWITVEKDSSPTKDKYNGATPKSLPFRIPNALKSSDGKIALVAESFAVVSKKEISEIDFPDNFSGFDNLADNEVFTAVFINPNNSNQIFVGSNFGNLYEYINNNRKHKYEHCANGKIVDMELTPEGDLIVLSQNKNNPVTILDHNGNWHVATSFGSMNYPTPQSIVKISDYLFAVNIVEKGLFYIDMKGTPLDFGDDVVYTEFPKLPDGSSVGSKVTALTMDFAGNLFVGTDKGVAYVYNPEKLIEGATSFLKPIITESSPQDGNYSQYLLSSKTILDIAVDAANRKWISAMGAGVFLVTEKCDEEILRFNERNSPLPSDTVMNIEFVQKTGEVFFSTKNGVVAYLSDIQAACNDLSNVVVYPNPVRPDYDGDVYISGLEDGCDIRITDVAGHLVFKTEAVGGRIAWDGKNLNGNRCATGVYLIFIINTFSGDKTVKKLLFVR